MKGIVIGLREEVVVQVVAGALEIREHWKSWREARIDRYLGLPFFEFAASLGSGKFQGRA